MPVGKSDTYSISTKPPVALDVKVFPDKGTPYTPFQVQVEIKGKEDLICVPVTRFLADDIVYDEEPSADEKPVVAGGKVKFDAQLEIPSKEDLEEGLRNEFGVHCYSETKPEIDFVERFSVTVEKPVNEPT